MNVQKHLNILRFLSSDKCARKILPHLPKEIVKTIAEIAYNLVRRNASLSVEEEAYIEANVKLLRRLCSKRTPIKDKTAIVSGLNLELLLRPAIRRFENGGQNETSSNDVA